MVNEEEAVGIVFGLHLPEPVIVAAPERLLPGLLEVVTFRDIGARAWRNFAELTHRSFDRLSRSRCVGEVGVRNSARCVCRSAAARNNGKGKGVASRGVDCRISGRGPDGGGRP